MKHIFDLDLTIWVVTNRNGNRIWAKQLVFPLTILTDNIIIDDVGSRCELKPGVREYLEYLQHNSQKVGFISAGRHWQFEDFYQPSIHLLEMFELMNYFNDLKILTYKNVKKSTHFQENNEVIVFYDDDDEVIKDLSTVEGIKVVDAKKITDWSLMVRKYD